MVASASPEQYAQSLRCLLDDPGVHNVLVILVAPPMFAAGAVAKALIPVIQTADKPVILAVMGHLLIQEAVAHLRAVNVPEYRFPEKAASALAVLSQRAEFLARAEEAPLIRDDIDVARVRALLAEAEAGFLPQAVTDRILEAYGVPPVPTALAQDAQAAARLASEMGFPVALKVASPDIPHKSDVGGVLLNVEDERAVVEGFETIMANARQVQPEAEIQGVHVQRMILGGQEVIIGAVQDPQFGALAMFGSGGVEVEGLKDVAFALAPLTAEEATHMLESTWAGQKLHGYRNLPPADRAAVTDALSRLAQLAADFPHIAEVEINPLRVLPAGKGAFAIDVRMRIDEVEE
jgi:acetyltransferase